MNKYVQDMVGGIVNEDRNFYKMILKNDADFLIDKIIEKK